MKIFIIIPAYNEREAVNRVIERAQCYGQVVLVDDGSTDDTLKRVQSCGVLTLRHCVNCGQGAALKTGIDYALASGAEIIVTMDSDGQHRPEEIPQIVKPIERGEVDIVLGSRFLEVSTNGTPHNSLRSYAGRAKDHKDCMKFKIPFSKEWLVLKPAIFFERLFTGLKLTDVHQGFRAMSREAAKKIQITQDKMAHATEIISEIKRNKLRCKEVPVTVVYNEYGQGMGGAWKILKDLFFKKIVY
ncbi:glycosyltransferase family 2 protein [Patescibacteria group bacterium]|nr:glycosyltransferase family 2 protein [Patescibacteria group bacterium]MBU4512439.1 glycosyltransferase family 2 protein [Patescibacteria group bacterium]MCG2691764.1 glycosyltransferase family 2 protein [Microgenomates group bacterium]MCG2692567.1 glycosyltransferase family 2 protein [Candidatus Parcubacteria bacterium]